MSPKLFKFIGFTGILILAMLFLAPTGTEAADSTWFAQYFNNTNVSGGPVLSRQEQELNHSWGTKNNDLPGVSKDNFSARWTRRVHFPTTGTYRFSGTMDDGMRVWVDGALVIDAWTTGSERTITGDRYLTAGDHDVKVEFFDAVLFATARLNWQLASTGTPPTNITNWRGEYYNNTNLTGAAALIRDDAAINFNWNQGTPAPGIVSTDNFSVRWTRNMNFNAGRYQFSAATDDGVRLWVNNVLIIDNWRTQSLTTKTAEIDLPGGSIPVRMEYFEATGGANAVLSWSQVGVNTPNWRGEYYNNTSLVGGPALIRDDANINFNWGDGSPAAGVSSDNFSVRWTRSIVLNPGRHRFTTRTDDGVRLWVNNQLVIDRWHAMAPTTHEAEVELFGGPVSIKMEYFDLTGGAQASLNITQVTTPPTGGPGSGQGGVGSATVLSTLLNVRQGPAISYPIITTITRGTVVQLGGYRNATTTWVMVILSNGQTGWSYAPFLQTTYNLPSLQVWTEPGSGGTPSGPTATVYGAYYLNVRSGPGTTYAPFMTLARGTVVTMIGRNNSGGWLKIQTAGGTQGWSSASYLQTTYNVMNLPVLAN